MFEDENMSEDFGKLFDDSVTEEPVQEEQEVEESTETEEEKEPAEETTEEEVQEESEESEESQESEEEQPEQKEQVVATIEIDGKEFPLDEMKIQKIAEQYIEVSKQNKVFAQDREQVVQVMQIVDNIRNGVDIDESMQALGVNFEALIHDKVKDFIRRSTMSAKERELEDANREREKLRKQIAEREQREAEQREAELGQRQANTIIDSVNTSLLKVPEKFRKEIQIEVFGAIERRIRQGGQTPSAKAIQNAVNNIYERKYKLINDGKKPDVNKKVVRVPNITKNNPTPSTNKRKQLYNATDYNEIFR